MAHKKKMSPTRGAEATDARVPAAKRSRSTPMAQQRPDLGAPSAPQTLVQLIGCSDPKARSDQAARRRQAAGRSKAHH